MDFTRTNRLDHGDDPIAALLRKHAMKTPFIEHLEESVVNDETHRKGIYPDVPGSKLIIYGSTLMWRLALDGAKMPFIGLKVSDVDIGVVQPGARFGSEENFLGHVSPDIRNALEATDLKLVRIKPGNNQRGALTEADFDVIDPRNIQTDALVGDFYVCKDFSPADIQKVVASLGDSPETKNIESYININGSPKRVFMAVSAHAERFPILMEPIGFSKKENGCNQLYRHDRYDSLAGKLARCLSANPKATDLIDIYNMTQGHFSDGKPMLRLQGEESRENVLRLLTLLYACNNAYTLQDGIMRKDIFKCSRLTDNNIAWFKEEVTPQLAKHRRDALLEKTPEVLESVNGLFNKIFPPIAEDKSDTLWSRLHPDEKAFVCKFLGRDYLPNILQPVVKKGWFIHLTKVPSSRLTQQDPEQYIPHRKASPGEPKCQLDINLIADRYQTAFGQYPKLRYNINASEMMANRLQELNYGHIESTPNIDF